QLTGFGELQVSLASFGACNFRAAGWKNPHRRALAIFSRNRPGFDSRAASRLPRRSDDWTWLQFSRIRREDWSESASRASISGALSVVQARALRQNAGNNHARAVCEHDLDRQAIWRTGRRMVPVGWTRRTN